jgi:hypothetical protein
MYRALSLTVAVTGIALTVETAADRQPSQAPPRPAEGYGIHVTAPHLYQGREIGPVHHFCKPISPEPIIVCLLFDAMDANAPLSGVEYIVAKTLTRPSVPLGTWNQNFHDHTVEIASGRVRVHDVPDSTAKQIADLVATTDGIIFHLWPMGDRFPTGTVVVDQAVGHRPLTAQEYAASAAPKPGN